MKAGTLFGQADEDIITLPALQKTNSGRNYQLFY